MSNMTSAEICRKNGWDKGTRLKAVTGHGRHGTTTAVIAITAIGEEAVLAKHLLHNGSAPTFGPHESTWELGQCDWEEVKKETGASA